MERPGSGVEGSDLEEKGQNKDFAALSISTTTTSNTASLQDPTRKSALLRLLSSVCSITPPSLVIMVCLSALISALLSILPLVLHLQPAEATVTVYGATGGVYSNGSRPVRQEISFFQDSGPPMDLFVLAFRAFQQVDQSNVLSYYQVAGIHGYPNKAWDGVNRDGLNGGNDLGYCTHNSVVFPPWHRPYIALFEQILWGHAQAIAKTYPLSQRSKYIAAATTLRLPYWDWALNPSMPTTFTIPTIDVNSPSGKVTVPNPLYNYTFHPLPLGTDFPTDQPLSFYGSTVRNPDKDGRSQQAISNQALVSESASILSLTYGILSSEKNYSMMSNSVLGTYNSIENIHNGIHTWVGGTGHMALIPWSSFDPIFWIHHAQVDRIFALWQALNPTSYVEPTANEMGTFTEQPGFVETLDTPLTPFRFSSSQFYTAATARSTGQFGYTYSELSDWAANASQLQSTVRTKVNQLYNPTKNPAFKRGMRGVRKIKAPKATGHHLVDSGSNETVDNDMMRTGPVTVTQCMEMEMNNLPMQWAVSFQVDKFILSSPFSIHVFLTTPPADPAQWATCPQHVGSGTIFTMANMTAQPSIVVSGQVPLTHALAQAVEYGILASLEATHVVPLLTAALVWRIQKVNGDPVDTEDLVDGKGKGRLKIGVISREVMPRVRDDAFPIYESWETWPAITAGKAGGTKAAKAARPA